MEGVFESSPRKGSDKQVLCSRDFENGFVEQEATLQHERTSKNERGIRPHLLTFTNSHPDKVL